MTVRIENHLPPAALITPVVAMRRTRTGMSLTELLLSLALVYLGLGGVALVSESLRTSTADRQTRDTLRTLQACLSSYHDRHGSWPPGPTASDAIKAMLDDPVTAPLIKPLRLSADADGSLQAHDGYGCPIRYLLRPHGSAIHAQFVSAGPDGQFGDLTSEHQELRSHAMDNVYSSDLETPTP